MRKKSKSPRVSASVSSKVLNTWLTISVLNAGVWCIFLFVVLEHAQKGEGIQSSGDLILFGLTLLLTVLAVAVTISLAATRATATPEKEFF